MTLAGFCTWAGRFESYLIENPEDRVSRDMVHIMVTNPNSLPREVMRQIQRLNAVAKSRYLGTIATKEYLCIQLSIRRDVRDKKIPPLLLWLNWLAQILYLTSQLVIQATRQYCDLVAGVLSIISPQQVNGIFEVLNSSVPRHYFKEAVL